MMRSKTHLMLHLFSNRYVAALIDFFVLIGFLSLAVPCTIRQSSTQKDFTGTWMTDDRHDYALTI